MERREDNTRMYCCQYINAYSIASMRKTPGFGTPGGAILIGGLWITARKAVREELFQAVQGIHHRRPDEKEPGEGEEEAGWTAQARHERPDEDGEGAGGEGKGEKDKAHASLTIAAHSWGGAWRPAPLGAGAHVQPFLRPSPR